LKATLFGLVSITTYIKTHSTTSHEHNLAIILRLKEMISIMSETISTSCTPQQHASEFVDDDSRWEAVKSRNAKADGLFVYAVRSTGVYSRPTCKARLAHRFNTAFFKTSIEAQSAGYRPCKRCHPEDSAPMPEDMGVAKIRAFVKKRPLAAMMQNDGTITMMSLSDMARQAGLSKWHFHREFKKCFGVTPVEYLRIGRKTAKLALSSEAQDDGSLPKGECHDKSGVL
jgi:methylphosphotriester-DNA--protein-cysteine methyltransferase